MTDMAKPSGTQSLGIGSLIGDAFSLTFSNFLKFLVLMIIPLIVVSALGYVMFNSLINQAMSVMLDPAAQEQFARELIANWVTYLVMYIIFIIVVMLAYSFAYAAGIHIVFEAKLGRSANLGQAFATGLSRMPALFTVNLVLGLLLAIVFGIIGYAFATAGLPVVGQIATIVLMLYYIGLTLPMGGSIVVERQWFGAIERSFTLSSGYRWWIVLMMILFSLAMIVIYLGIALVGFLVGQIGGTVAAVLMAIVGLCGFTIIFGVGIAVVALCYARLREIKEGTTMESLADVFD